MSEAPTSTTDGTDDPTAAVDRAYRLILGRSADGDGARRYVRQLHAGELTVRDVCAALAASDEFADRLRTPNGPPGTTAAVTRTRRPLAPGDVDAAELIRTTSLEELAARAETYFTALDDPDQLLTKPAKDVAEAPEVLVTFGQVLRALKPLPGMTILDFGAGTCWTSRFLTQLGCRVISLDVSPTALTLGRRLYELQPVLGTRPEPEFLVFDGHHVDLPDASVDRVLSYDALHHVPNPQDVVRELGRLLAPGGIAAFAEPGAEHSRQPQSQYEMRHYGVLENDVIIEDIWEWAQEAGFTELRLCLLESSPQWVDLDTFHAVLAGTADAATFPEPTRAAIADRRLFWLRKAGADTPDSREADGLVADLTMTGIAIDTRADGTRAVTGTCHVRNPGPRTWLPSDAEHGPVRLGARARLAGGTVRDVARVPLPGNGIAPGESVDVAVYVELPPQEAPVSSLELDLVSEFVCWFSVNGSPVVEIPLDGPVTGPRTPAS